MHSVINPLVVQVLLFGLVGIISIATIIFWIWALVDCLLRPEESYEKMFGTISPKLVWALIIFLGQLIGAIIYVFVAGTRRNPKRASVKVDSTGTDEGKRILQMIAEGKISSEDGQRLLVALGEKETKKAESQPTAKPTALKIGCGILVVLLILAFFMFASIFFFRMPRANTVSRQMKIEKEIGGQLQKIQIQNLPPFNSRPTNARRQLEFPTDDN